MKRLYLSLFFLISSPTFANQCIAVDGPANVREEPNKKIILSLPKESTVIKLPTAKDAPQGWFRVWGYRKGKNPSRCSESHKEEDETLDFFQGWMHESNFLKNSSNEVLRLDPSGVLDTMEVQNDLKPHKKVVAKSTCNCIAEHRFSHDRGRNNVKTYAAGDTIGTNCSTNQKLAICTAHHGTYTEEVTCPNKDCLTITDSKRIDKAQRLNILHKNASEAKSQVQKKVPANFLGHVTSKHKDWIPFLLPDIHRNNDYEYELNLSEYYLNHSLQYASLEKKRSLFIFFANAADAFELIPTVAFEGKDKIEYRRFPFNLKASREDIDSPVVCAAATKVVFAIVGCRRGNEITPFLSAFDLKSPKAETLSYKDILKNRENSECCGDLFLELEK